MFSVKNPISSFERPLGRVFIYHFHTSEILAKIHSLATVQFLFRLCCVAGCSSGGLRNPLSELVFHRRKDSFSWEIRKEGLWAHFRYLAPEKTIPIIYNAVLVGNCIILEGNFRGGSIGSFRVFPCSWRVQPFIGGDLWGDLQKDIYYFNLLFHELQLQWLFIPRVVYHHLYLGVFPETLLEFSWKGV